MNKNIKVFKVKTKKGNTLSFFYNPDNDLVVLDLIRADETGGNEIFRMKLKEENLLNMSHHLSSK
jgi:hypothetical protein